MAAWGWPPPELATPATLPLLGPAGGAAADAAVGAGSFGDGKRLRTGGQQQQVVQRRHAPPATGPPAGWHDAATEAALAAALQAAALPPALDGAASGAAAPHRCRLWSQCMPSEGTSPMAALLSMRSVAQEQEQARSARGDSRDSVFHHVQALLWTSTLPTSHPAHRAGRLLASQSRMQNGRDGWRRPSAPGWRSSQPRACRRWCSCRRRRRGLHMRARTCSRSYLVCCAVAQPSENSKCALLC